MATMSRLHFAAAASLLPLRPEEAAGEAKVIVVVVV